MGYEKYIKKSEETEKIILKINEDEIPLTIRSIPWVKRMEIRDNCLSWDSTGSGKLHMSVYNRECLKYLIVDAPWGKTTEMFLLTVDDKLGMALEKLVPSPYSETDNINIEILKKE